MDENLRETLDKQFDAVVAAESAPPVDAAEPVASAGEEQVATPDKPEPPQQQAADMAEPVDAEVPTEVKDDKSSTPTPAPSPVGAETLDHAPGTWTAAGRETWKDLPPAARQEVWKREKDAVRALTISTKARKFTGDFEQMMQPYMGFIAAEGVNPLQAVNFMMQTGALLRTGSAQAKAELVANVIKQWSIDVELVDDIMQQWRQSGWAPSNRQQTGPKDQIREAAREILNPVLQQLQARQQAEEAALDAEISEDLNEFAKKNEFFNDVRDDMADLLEIAKKRGVKLSLTEAYRRATLASEPVQQVLRARKTRQGVQQNQSIADQARAAAASVPGTTAASVASAPAQGGSIRSILEDQFAKLSGS